MHINFGIQPPHSIAGMFGSLLHGLRLTAKNQILLGAAAICRSIWLNRNDIMFNKAKLNTF
jgi:hypothetical protein